MATPKKLEFSSDGDNSNGFSPSRRKSSRKHSSKRSGSEAAAAEESKTNNNKSPVSNRIWNEEDELALLKGLVDYRAKTTGHQTKIDWDEFYRFMGGSSRGKFSKEQVLSKTKKLKRKFLLHMEKINEGIDPQFTRSSDSEAFGFSMMLWDINDAEYTNGGIDQSKNDQEVALNENGAGKSDFNGNKSHHEAIVADKIRESDDDDELLDAFETMVSQGLTDYQKQLQLEKLKNLGTRKKES